MSRGNNWADVLDQDLDYLVLRKDNRLQILVRPPKKQVRRRGRRGWSLVEAVSTSSTNGTATPPDQLREVILHTLQDMVAGKAGGEKKKAKKSKGKKAESQA